VIRFCLGHAGYCSEPRPTTVACRPANQITRRTGAECGTRTRGGT
jgi:hypothetical protein